MSTQCSRNSKRLPTAWINIIKNRMTKKTGVWADYNTYANANFTMDRAADDKNGIFCEDDVPYHPDVDDFSDISAPTTLD